MFTRNFRRLYCLLFGHTSHPVLHYAALYDCCKCCGRYELLANTDELERVGLIEVELTPIPFYIQSQIDAIFAGHKK